LSSKFTTPGARQVYHSPASFYHFLFWIADEILSMKKLLTFCSEGKRSQFKKDITLVEKEMLQLGDHVSYSYKNNNLADPENSMSLLSFILDVIEECSKKQGIYNFFYFYNINF